MLSATKAAADQPCSRCEAVSPRYLSAPSFAFGGRSDGARPQNTGATSVDLDWDRAVGRDAEVQWEAVSARLARKRQIMAETGATGFDLTATPSTEAEGPSDYRVMRPEERRAAETARSLHHGAVNKIKAFIADRKQQDSRPRAAGERPRS